MRGMVLVLVAAFLGMAVTERSALANDLFQGKWNVTITPEEGQRGERPAEDVLVFKGASFWAEGYLKRGFQPTEYEPETARFGPGKFQATQKSAQEGALKWQGTAVVQQIEGTVIWTKPDGTEVRYAFKGSKM